jgi:hypothetical protein
MQPPATIAHEHSALRRDEQFSERVDSVLQCHPAIIA